MYKQMYINGSYNNIYVFSSFIYTLNKKNLVCNSENFCSVKLLKCDKICYTTHDTLKKFVKHADCQLADIDPLFCH